MISILKTCVIDEVSNAKQCCVKLVGAERHAESVGIYINHAKFERQQFLFLPDIKLIEFVLKYIYNQFSEDRKAKQSLMHGLEHQMN